jgi:hypothetical protein
MNKITKKKLTTLKPNDSNPRLIQEDQFKKLVSSLKEFPEMLEARPIVVDPNNVILGGNMRYRAALEIGLKEIPVYVASWEEAKQRQFVIKDNVPFGSWDWNVLANEWNAEELNDWGLNTFFDDGDINTFFDDPELPEPNLKSASALLLQYTPEEFEQITEALDNLAKAHGESREKIVFDLVLASV